jgi:peptidoglycan glycosyltransferase
MDYPRSQMTPSGVFGEDGELLDANDPVDVGRVAIGQERLQVTPLQMAMVAAAVGNGGTLMKPRLTDRVVDKDGRVTERIEPDEEDRVMEEETATQLADMMADVVNEGTGTAAALSGIQVAGKTGTAEVDGGASNQAWFIAFAPVDDPQMAIAVTVERTSGQGGTVAAPIAKQVLESLVG